MSGKPMRELEGKYKLLYDHMSDFDQQLIDDTLESMSDDIEVKAVNYAIIIKKIKALREGRKQEVKFQQAKMKAETNNINRLMEDVMSGMKTTNKVKIEDPKATIRLNRGRESVEITDPDKLPVDCYEPQSPRISKTKVKEMLQKGRQVDGAQMVRHESLSIR